MIRKLHIFISCAFVNVALGQLPQGFEKMFEAMQRNAEIFYPAIANAPGAPEGTLIGFVVNRDMQVLRHSVGFRKEGAESIAAQLERMFPAQKLTERGGGCFGLKATEPRYCVVWGRAAQ